MGDVNVWSWCYPLGGAKGPALPPPLWVATATPDSQPLSTVYENEDQLLWSPSVLPEREVEEFLYRAVKRRWQEMAGPQIPEGEVVKDSEQVGGHTLGSSQGMVRQCGQWDGAHIEPTCEGQWFQCSCHSGYAVTPDSCHGQGANTIAAVEGMLWVQPVALGLWCKPW